MYLAYDYPLLGAFWTVLWISLWVMWFFLLFRIIADIFRDDSLSGWAKAGWCVFTLVLPFLGVFVYLIARGKSMGTRETQRVHAQQREFDDYIRRTASTPASHHAEVAELERLSEIRARGDISEEEYKQAKEKILH